MSRTKDHFTCSECYEIHEEVPGNGGWCNKCDNHHGWTYMAEKAPEMERHVYSFMLQIAFILPDQIVVFEFEVTGRVV